MTFVTRMRACKRSVRRWMIVCCTQPHPEQKVKAVFEMFEAEASQGRGGAGAWLTGLYASIC
jgi:hypothetical protein